MKFLNSFFVTVVTMVFIISCSSSDVGDGNDVFSSSSFGEEQGNHSSSSVISSSTAATSSSSNLNSSSSSVTVGSDKDNFHIYLAFGQSNMEGQCITNNSVVYSDVLPSNYKTGVSNRFQVMAAVNGGYKLANGTTQQRTKGQWYTAVPPLVRQNLCLSPVDYFGRTIVANTPNNIKVGIIVVAVGGAKIDGFVKGQGANNYYNTLPANESYMKQYAANYDYNPYNHLVTLAKEAQKVGTIKGILMHQGESGGTNWANSVQGIYNNILSDLGLPANSIPFLAGEPYSANKALVTNLPNSFNATMPNGQKVVHVIQSQGLSVVSDGLHFNYESYKTLGERYGNTMLDILSEP